MRPQWKTCYLSMCLFWFLSDSLGKKPLRLQLCRHHLQLLWLYRKQMHTSSSVDSKVFDQIFQFSQDSSKTVEGILIFPNDLNDLNCLWTQALPPGLWPDRGCGFMTCPTIHVTHFKVKICNMKPCKVMLRYADSLWFTFIYDVWL